MRPYVHFKTHQKVISMFLVLCFFVIPLSVLTLPKKVDAVCMPAFKPALPDPFSVPVHNSATSPTNQFNEFMKGNTFFTNCILDGIAVIIAKTIIKSLTASIVNWINSGFKGNPSFVQNTGAFFSGIADKVAGQVIEGIAPFLCSPFKLNIQLALALNQAKDKNDVSCSLTDVEKNFSDFVSGIGADGKAGGSWGNWFNITQNPQNNPYGAMMLAQAKLTSQVQQAQGKYQQQLDWGSGFLGFEDCPSDPYKGGVSGGPSEAKQIGTPAGEGGTLPAGQAHAMANPSDSPRNTYNNSLASIGSLGLLDSIFGDNANNNSLAAGNNAVTTNHNSVTSVTNSRGTTLTPVNGHKNLFADPYAKGNKPVYYSDAPNTPVYGVYAADNGCLIKTPGAVVENQLENFLGSDLRGLELAQSIDQIFQALVGQLVSQALGGIGGLLGGGNGGGGGGGSRGTSEYQKLVDRMSGNKEIPVLPILGSCASNSQTAKVGELVTWTTYIPKINGEVTFEWEGDGNLSGTSSATTTRYTTNGTKKASVIVTTSGENPQSVEIDCGSVEVGDFNPAVSSTPTISCSASPNTVSVNTPVTWQAVVVGGTPPFNYLWQGDEGLEATGQSTVKSYRTASVVPKTARIYVTGADGYTYMQDCVDTVLVTP